MKTEFFSFNELQINPEDIEELMGFEPGQSPAPFPELIDDGLNQASEVCHIVGGYRIFTDFSIDSKSDTIRINDKIFYPGKKVVLRMKTATQAALFLCTAGAKITEHAKQKSAQGDELMAFVLDTIGSVAAEKAADCLLENILNNIKGLGLGITDAFSPGYCNWNVAEQQKLFSLLPSTFCHISLSSTSLMHPVKSISGITGIGAGCERTGYQCNWCTDLKCIYGKIRRSKKGKKNL